jgi:large subunit ribosomal protein L23
MDIYHTIIRPLVTEKSSHQAASGTDTHGASYSFQVNPKANKTQIREAVEKIYNVKVVSVRTMMGHVKPRRFRVHWGQTTHTKKAIVTLDPGSHIDLF